MINEKLSLIQDNYDIPNIYSVNAFDVRVIVINIVAFLQIVQKDEKPVDYC